MPTTGVAKYPYPNASAVPDVPGDVLLLAQRIAKMNGAGIGYSATTADRTAKVTNSDVFEGYRDYDAQTGIVYKYTSSAWRAWDSDWITYTPTLAGFVVGTGGSAASVVRYKYVTGDIKIDFKFVFGSSGATFPTSPTFTLPVGVALPTAPWSNFELAHCALLDSGTSSTLAGLVGYSATATDKVLLTYKNGFATVTSILAASVPWVWAAGDGMAGRFEFTPA